MKKIFFGLIAIVLLSNFSFGQTTSKEWLSMMQNFQLSVDKVLMSECPKDLDLQKFKISIINGESIISENAKNTIENLNLPLIKYGKEFALKQKLESIDDSSLIFYANFPPDLIITNNDSQILGKIGGGGGLTWGEVGQCVLAALGADAAWAWAAGSGTSWSIAALTTTFSGVAKRFLGPIGVGIAVATFSFCLYQSY